MDRGDGVWSEGGGGGESERLERGKERGRETEERKKEGEGKRERSCGTVGSRMECWPSLLERR